MHGYRLTADSPFFISINFSSLDHINHKVHPNSITLSAHVLENRFHVENILVGLYYLFHLTIKGD